MRVLQIDPEFSRLQRRRTKLHIPELLRSKLPLIALALTAALSHPAAAQRPVGKAPSRGPGWLPRESHIEVGQPYSRAEIAEVIARLEAIERIVARSGVFERPHGFEIEPNLYGGGDAGTVGGDSVRVRGTVIGYSYALGMYAPTRKIAGEGTNCVRINVNSPAGGNKLPYSNGAGDMFLEWEHGDPVSGATSVWNRLSPTERSWVDVVLTSRGAPFWKTVTRGDFLDAVLVQMQGDPEKMAEARTALSETPYHRWRAGAVERKQMRDIVVAALDPSERAATRKKMEEEERATTEQLKAGEAKYRASIGDELGLMTKVVDSMRTRIAAMSPADRAIPAWLDRIAGPDAFAFVAPNSANAVRVLQFNPEFFRARRSRVEARSIWVHLSASLTCQRPEIHRAVFKALNELDWAALGGLLEP